MPPYVWVITPCEHTPASIVGLEKGYRVGRARAVRSGAHLLVRAEAEVNGPLLDLARCQMAQHEALVGVRTDLQKWPGWMDCQSAWLRGRVIRAAA